MLVAWTVATGVGHWEENQQDLEMNPQDLEKSEEDVSTFHGWLVLVIRWGTKRQACGGEHWGNLKYR